MTGIDLHLIAGIACGLVTAVCHAGAYVLGRRYVVKHHRGGAMRQFVMAHVMMGVVAAMALPLIVADDLPPLGGFLPDIIGAAGFYFIGQLGLFATLRKAEASRVSPLLGMKVVFVAVIAVALLGQRLNWLQWGAVGLAVASAFVLNATGGRLPHRAVAIVMGTCMLFAVSDIFIKKLTETMAPLGVIRGSVVAALAGYVFCALVSLPMLPWYGSRKIADWRDCIPYAAVWIVGILFMFVCYAYVGVVLGVMVVSLRGLFSILLGALLARLGHHHLEQHVARRIVVRRAAAALMMIAAIGTFYAVKASS